MEKSPRIRRFDWVEGDAILRKEKFREMKEEKNRHTVWLTDDAWELVEEWYQKDNCSTKNEYIEKAIRFYSGYLDSERAEEYLPRVLAQVCLLYTSITTTPSTRVCSTGRARAPQRQTLPPGSGISITGRGEAKCCCLSGSSKQTG